MKRSVSLSTEQRSLSRWPAEGGGACGLVRAFLVEAETFAMDLEEAFGRFPVLTFPAHAFAEDAGVEFAAASFADSVHYSVGFGRQLVTQTVFTIWRYIDPQA